MHNPAAKKPKPPPPSSPPSVQDWLSAAVGRLNARSIDTARLDARLLLQDATGMSSAMVIAHPERRLSADETARLERSLARRLADEPVSRILGYREFYGRRFAITPATLDPRPDSETLIDAALQLAKSEGWHGKPIRIIDVGTGSGCLLLTLLAELPMATGLGTDISAAALEVAGKNAQALGLGQRARFRLTRSLDLVNEEFDLLVSNPPYVISREIATLASGVRRYDPLSALDGGPDGLDIYRDVARCVSFVIPTGWAFFEVAAGQAAAVAGLLVAANPTFETEKSLNLRDLGGHQRVVALRPGNP